jgi:hypothetical protein
MNTNTGKNSSHQIIRGLVNGFLILFLLDGCLSVLDEVVSLFAPVSMLSGVRSLIANAVIVMSVALYFSLGIDKRLPKPVFLPLIAFVWFCPLSLWLFPGLTTFAFYGLFTALSQLLILLLVTARFQASDRRSFLMPETAFAAPAFGWKNTAGFAVVTVAILPFFLVLLTLFSADTWAQQNTAGFMRVAPDGVHMLEKVYRRGEKTVRLVAMVHIGEKQYYQGLSRQQSQGRAIVLAEGVTDEKQLLKNRLDYGSLAGYVGLVPQRDQLMYKGRLIDDGQLEEQQGSASDARNGEPDIVRADVDLSSFRPTTVWFIEELAKQMKHGRTLREQLLGCMEWWNKSVTPEMQETIVDDLLHKRNRELIRHFDSAVKRYDTIIIPWGAMHMAEIEPEVVKQGFHLQQTYDHVSVHFAKRT